MLVYGEICVLFSCLLYWSYSGLLLSRVKVQPHTYLEMNTIFFFKLDSKVKNGKIKGLPPMPTPKQKRKNPGTYKTKI